MAKILVQEINPYAKLYRDPKSGIAWVEDTSAGLGHSCHPNISATGSVRGMKSKGWWGEKDRTVRSHGWIYNIDHCVTTSAFDNKAREACRCGGDHTAPPSSRSLEQPTRIVRAPSRRTVTVKRRKK